MNKDEFRRKFSCVEDVMNWCLGNGCEGFCSDWVLGSDLDEVIESDLIANVRDYLRSNYWYQLLDELSSIERHYNVYRKYEDSWFVYEALDYELDDIIEDLIETLEADGFFEDEEEGGEVFTPDEECECDVAAFLFASKG